jgi:hypothetical protein
MSNKSFYIVLAAIVFVSGLISQGSVMILGVTA